MAADSKFVSDVFAQLDKLLGAGPTPKTKLFGDEDLSATDVPFQLVAHGAGGDVAVVADDLSNGLDAPASAPRPSGGMALPPLLSSGAPSLSGAADARADLYGLGRSPVQYLADRLLLQSVGGSVAPPRPLYTPLPFSAPLSTPAAQRAFGVDEQRLAVPREHQYSGAWPFATGGAIAGGGGGAGGGGLALPDSVAYAGAGCNGSGGADDPLTSGGHVCVSSATSTLALVRHPLDGRVVGWDEVPLAGVSAASGGGSSGSGGGDTASGLGVAGASSSQSMLRAPSARREFVRGSSANLPFRPGGLEPPSPYGRAAAAAAASTTAVDTTCLFPWDTPPGSDPDSALHKLLTVPPGFERGGRLPAALHARLQAAKAKADAAAAKMATEAAAAAKAAADAAAAAAKNADVKAEARVGSGSTAPTTTKTKYQLYRARLASEQQTGSELVSKTAQGDAAERAAVAWAKEIKMPDLPGSSASGGGASAGASGGSGGGGGLYKVGANPSGLLASHVVLDAAEEQALAASLVQRKRERAARAAQAAAAARPAGTSGAGAAAAVAPVRLTDVVAELGDESLLDGDDDDDDDDPYAVAERAQDAAEAKRLARTKSPFAQLDSADAKRLAAAAASEKEEENNAALDELLAGAERFGSELKGVSSTFASLPKRKVVGAGGRSKQVWAETSRLNAADFHRDVPHPAIQYPFELDDFQKKAVMHLEKGESVFVAAHTSAGKTVVAEYAIALAMKHLTRAVYTSPIKTLSNQKFREFRKTFGEKDVGVITGDVQINPDASCLILTTEILRSMLYKGADLIRDIEWVVFDEVHYVADLERGVVWEEVIIMLPAHIGIILLSATVHNVDEFADWVGRTKRRKVHVLYTDKRPVPLAHHLWCKGNLYPIYSHLTGWQPEGFKQARLAGETDKDREKKKQIATLGRGPGFMKQPKWTSEKSQWNALVTYLKKRELLPVAVFYFSKKKCEESAFSMGAMDLTTTAEKAEIHRFVDAALQRLQPVDRKLPQVSRVKDLLKKGVGVHHAGILPILKEVVEMVFQRGLVKVLFATETFAMGVNMPTKTVVFSNLRKHDGHDFRNLLPGEYTQMAGRAGRRGLDSFGYVVIHCKDDQVPDEGVVRAIVTGKPSRLESRFRLTYNMILNLLRQEDLKVEDMIKRSFSEWATHKDEPDKQRFLKRGESKLQAMRAAGAGTGADSGSGGEVACPHHTRADLDTYYRAYATLEDVHDTLMRLVMTDPKASDKLLCVGRVLLVTKYDWPTPALAVVLSSKSAERKYVAFVLVPAGCVVPRRLLATAAAAATNASRPGAGAAAAAAAASYPQFGTATNGLAYAVDDLRPTEIRAILRDTDKLADSQVRGILLDKHASVIASTSAALLALTDRYGTPFAGAGAGAGPGAASGAAGAGAAAAAAPGALTVTKRVALGSAPSIAPESELKLKGTDLDLADRLAERSRLTAQLAALPTVHTCPSLRTHLQHLRKQATLALRLAQIKQQLQHDNANTDLLADFDTRLVVLDTLQYIAGTGNSNRTGGGIAGDRSIQLKGRVACEINTCDSLIVTELIFENVFVGLTPPEIVSLLSCLIFHEKDAVAPVLTDRLKKAYARLTDITVALANIQRKCGLDVGTSAEYVRAHLNPGLMGVVYEWARGTTFADCCKLTNVLEGSIVRCITRLDETCRDVRNAARTIGDPQLFQNMVVASEIIKRDIVFAASLYVA